MPFHIYSRVSGSTSSSNAPDFMASLVNSCFQTPVKIFLSFSVKLARKSSSSLHLLSRSDTRLFHVFLEKFFCAVFQDLPIPLLLLLLRVTTSPCYYSPPADFCNFE